MDIFGKSLNKKVIIVLIFILTKGLKDEDIALALSTRRSGHPCDIPAFRNQSTINLHSRMGNITSPQYGSKIHPRNQKCQWKFMITVREQLVLEIVKLRLIIPFFCSKCNSYLQLPNVLAGKRLCGIRSNETYVVCHHTNDICQTMLSNTTSQKKSTTIIFSSQWPPNITFQSDPFLEHKGFFLQYYVITDQRKTKCSIIVVICGSVSFVVLAIVTANVYARLRKKQQPKATSQNLSHGTTQSTSGRSELNSNENEVFRSNVCRLDYNTIVHNDLVASPSTQSVTTEP